TTRLRTPFLQKDVEFQAERRLEIKGYIHIVTETFDKYYLKTEDSPYYVAAIVLHPSRKSDYLKYNWEKKWTRPALQAVKNLWNEFKQHEEVLIPEVVTPKVTHKAQQDQEDDYDILLRNLQNFPKAISTSHQYSLDSSDEC
ncbi:hypothetical protein V8F06_001686, partial [Rhypophila decipiens]